MRKISFIAALLLALAASPWASAQQTILPARFGDWSGQPGPMWVETEAPSNYVDFWKETGRAPGEYC